MIGAWRVLLGLANAADRWLASGVYMSEAWTNRIARP